MLANATLRRFTGSLTIAKDAVATIVVAQVVFDLGTPSPPLVAGSLVIVRPRTAPANLLLGPGFVSDVDKVTVPIVNPTAGALPAAAFNDTFDVFVFTPTGAVEVIP